jgi:hypothetical protein
MDNTQKNAITDYNAPLSEPFRLQERKGLESVAEGVHVLGMHLGRSH